MPVCTLTFIQSPSGYESEMAYRYGMVLGWDRRQHFKVIPKIILTIIFAEINTGETQKLNCREGKTVIFCQETGCIKAIIAKRDLIEKLNEEKHFKEIHTFSRNIQL